MRWVFWPGTGCNGVTLHFCVLYPGESFDRHSHEYSEDVISVIKGKGKVLTAEGEIDIGEGQSVLARVGEVHGFKNTSSEPMITLGSQAPADLNLYRSGGFAFGKAD